MPDTQPWVAVVVLGYQQAAYLPACLASLEAHGLAGVQLILVDNGSGDGSAEQMKAWAARHPGTTMLLYRENLGHNRAFNQALALVEAPFVIDLAADDELTPGSLKARVEALQAEPEAAFCHGNALYIDKDGKPIGYEHVLGESNPAWSGHVWQSLFGQRFICPSSVLFRVSTMRSIGGYDEALSFEDFDIWMRLARDHRVCYVPVVVSRQRLHEGSASAAQVRRRNQSMLESTLLICQKALQMSRTMEERYAVARFAGYHMRLAAYSGHIIWVRRYAVWLEESLLPMQNAWLWKLAVQIPLGDMYADYARRQKRKGLTPIG